MDEVPKARSETGWMGWKSPAGYALLRAPSVLIKMVDDRQNLDFFLYSGAAGLELFLTFSMYTWNVIFSAKTTFHPILRSRCVI